MNKAIVFPMLFFLLILWAAAHEGTESVEGVLSEIQASQGAASIAQIECSKVSEHQFEELGDALMEKMHPGEAHSVMDSMMGGEGSQSLEAMHAAMGNAYLKCDGSGMMGGGGMMGMMPMMMNMMGSGMMGGQNPTQTNMAQGMMGPDMMQSMMGNKVFGSGVPFWNNGYWSIWNILFLVLLVGLIALVFLGVLKLLKSQRSY